MPNFFRLIACVVIATVFSMLYHSFQTSNTVAFRFDVITALCFVVTGLFCALIMVLGSKAGTAIGNASSASRHTHKTGREAGTVKWFSPGKGFGFITRENGEEVFVHFRSLDKSSRRLATGSNVEFIVNQSEKGPEAINVVVVD